MSTALHWLALAAYVAGSGLYLAFLWRQRRGLAGMGRAVLWAGFGLHTLALVAAWWQEGALPAASLRQSLDLFAWGLMGATLIINLRQEVMILGAITAPVCTILLLVASLMPVDSGPPAKFMASLWVVVHVLCLLAAYGALALTFLGGVLYLVEDRLLRAKRMGPTLRRLPPLSRLDAMSHAALLAGFVLLTLGIISGAVYAQITLGSYWRWDPKEVWALITWLMYAAVIHTRLVQGWRGRRGAWLAVAAFGALMFTFLGAGLLLPGYHAFESLPRLEEVAR